MSEERRVLQRGYTRKWRAKPVNAAKIKAYRQTPEVRARIAAWARAARAANPEYHRAQGRKQYPQVRSRRLQDPVGYLLHGSKYRARAVGLEWSLTRADLTIPAVCPLLGMPLVFSTGKGNTPNSPSIDRIDPSKGYVAGNVWVISRRANTIKNDARLEELERLVENLRSRVAADLRSAA